MKMNHAGILSDGLADTSTQGHHQSAALVPGSQTDCGKKVLVIISNGITPYGMHFLRRVANELNDFNLRTIYSYEFSMGHWQIAIPNSINAVILGKGEEATAQRGVGKLIPAWVRASQLFREIAACSPSAVMILGYFPVTHFAVLEWCRRKKIPCLMWADSNVRGENRTGMKAWIKRLTVSRAVSRCVALLPCGSLGAEYFQKYGARPEQIFFVPNEPDYSLLEGVTTDAVQSLREKYRLDPARYRVLFSGRLTHLKRVDLLIDAFAQLADERPNWDLLIVGSGPLDTELKARVPGRVQHRVIWAGYVDSPDRMAAFYHVADVLVLPSDYEPWGVVVNEAVFAGLALVCSDVVGAAADLLDNGINGRIFRRGDCASLLDSLREVTKEANLSRYKAASLEIIKRWRNSSDPVDGLRRALDFSLRVGRPEETNKARESHASKS